MSLGKIPYPVVPLEEALVALENGNLLQQGWSPRCHPRPAEGLSEWGVLKTTAVQPGEFNSAENKALPSTLTPRPQIAVQSGDLVLTNAGPRARCGVPALVRSTQEKRMLSGKIYRFRPNRNFDPEFLELWLLSPLAQKYIDQMKTGISDSGLNLTQSKFLRLPVPMPPIIEQRSIVSTAKEHLDRLGRARDSIKRARKLSDTQLGASLWTTTHVRGNEVQLRDIGEVKLGRQRSPKDHFGTRMVPYLRAANVDWNILRLDDVKAMNFTESEQKTFELRPGDIMLTEASGSAAEVGKSVLYEGTPAGVCFQNTLLRIRCTGANPRFVQKFLLAEAMAGRFVEDSRGVGIHHLGRSRLATWVIRLPDAMTQSVAADQAEEAVRVHRRLQSQTADALLRVESLRRSVLTAVFEGRLTERLRSGNFPNTLPSDEVTLIREAILT